MKWDFRYILGALICTAMVAPGPPSMAQAKANFWTPPKSTGQCGGSFSGIRSFKISKTVNRAKNPYDEGRLFAHYFGVGLSRTIKGQGVDQFKTYILNAARNMAFTKADFSGSSISPIYVQSNILRLIAMYMVTLESKGSLTSDERKVLVAWGNALVSGQKSQRGNKSADSRAASGNALMSWGAVTGNNGLVNTGKRQALQALPYLLRNVGSLRRHSAHKSVSINALSLEDEYNIALAHFIESAAMLRNMGIDVYSTKTNGRTLHDAVDWWADVIASRPKGFKGYSSKSHNFHVGWIPIYLHHFGNRPVAAKLRRIEKSVTGGRRPGFAAISLGGATDCFW